MTNCTIELLAAKVDKVIEYRNTNISADRERLVDLIRGAEIKANDYRRKALEHGHKARHKDTDEHMVERYKDWQLTAIAKHDEQQNLLNKYRKDLADLIAEHDQRANKLDQFDLAILHWLHQCYGTSKKVNSHVSPYLGEIRRNKDFVQGLPEYHLLEAIATIRTGEYAGNDGRTYKAKARLNDHNELEIPTKRYTVLNEIGLDFFTLYNALLNPAMRRYLSDLRTYFMSTSSFMASIDAQTESAWDRGQDNAIGNVLKEVSYQAPDVSLKDALEQVLSPSQLQYVLSRVYDDGIKKDDSKLKTRVQKTLLEKDIVIYNTIHKAYHI